MQVSSEKTAGLALIELQNQTRPAMAKGVNLETFILIQLRCNCLDSQKSALTLYVLIEPTKFLVPLRWFELFLFLRS